MLPIRLYLENFCGHSKTEFSFNDFSSALIIGKIKANERFSNGSGKSTIFNSIEYVLFNEIHFSSLEKIIRDGCDISRVEFEFLSSLDKNVYKIIRSNSRKTGTDVRLFKAIEDGKWEDLTQRRVSDTEKEIVKIVGFNYKAFCASVLFSQAGSENNVQKDFGNLPALTPEKRKSILREVLQLNVYTNYEKLAKSKYGSIQSSLERQKIILSTLGDPDVSLISLNKSNNNIENQLVADNLTLSLIRNEIDKLKAEHNTLSEKTITARNKINECKVKVINCNEQVIKHSKIASELKEKISKLPEEAKVVQNQIKEANDTLESLKEDTTDIAIVKEDIIKLSDKIQNIKVEIHTIGNKIIDLDKPISDDEVCTKCHQVVSEQHKHNWRSKVKEDLLKYNKQIYDLNVDLKILSISKIDLDLKVSAYQKNLQKATELETKLKYLNDDLNGKRSLYKNYNSLFEEHKIFLKEKNLELEKYQLELDNLVALDVDTLDIQKMDRLNARINELILQESKLTTGISKLIGEQAVIKHKITECDTNKKKIVEVKSEIQNLEKSLLLHSKVIQAFGSNGIPSLIIHSILDELQEEANKWLLKLRPGLQLQFIVVNDKNKKEQEDTLDIFYFIDGNQREYKQLSGAQKIVVSLAIKLALLFIMNKRLGVDIKLMLLDEVDQALDPGSTEIFADIIRVLQDEFKVMVITHNDDLKHKFSHAILVEQDENNVSMGKLISW